MTRYLKFIIISMALLAISVISYVQSVQEIDNPLFMIMLKLSRGHQARGILSILVLAAIGIVTLLIINTDFNTLDFLFLFFPVGVAVWIAASCILLLIGIPYSLFSTAVFFIGMWIVLLFLGEKRINIIEYDREVIIKFLIICIGVIALCSSGVLFTFMSSDSYLFIEQFGAAIAERKSIGVEFAEILSQSSLGPATLASLTYMLGVDNTFAVHHSLMISFNCLLCYSFYRKTQSKLITIASFAILFFSPCYVLLSGWVISNTYVMVFSFLIVFLSESETGNLSRERKIILSIIFFDMSLMRAEAPIIICCIAFSFFISRIHSKDIVKYFLLPSIVGTTAVYYQLLVRYRKYDGLLIEYDTVALMVMLYIVTVGYFILFRGKLDSFIRKNPLLVIDCGVLIISIILYFALGNMSGDIVKTLIYNFTSSSPNELWGISAGAIALIWLFFRINYGIVVTEVQIVPLLLYLMTFDLCFCRAFLGLPPRIGFGDSFNRTFISYLPLVVYACVTWLSYLNLQLDEKFFIFVYELKRKVRNGKRNMQELRK